jgi:Flp pilus assembly protein protease CpaA
MTNTHDAKVMADGAAVVVGLSGFMEWFPPVVALCGGLLTIVWMIIRIYETDTVQKLVHKNAVNK